MVAIPLEQQIAGRLSIKPSNLLGVNYFQLYIIYLYNLSDGNITIIIIITIIIYHY